MRKIFLMVFLTTVIISCKNDEKKETIADSKDQLAKDAMMSGNFMYYADAAVFQTKTDLYGVVENEMLQDLIIQSASLKTEASDEVAVTLKVNVVKKPENEEGWEYRIEILQIIKVSKANPDDNRIIKIEKEKDAENQ